MSNEKLRVGVLLAGDVQLLDASPMDLFGMISTEYLKACSLPKPITDLGLDVECLYISKDSPFSGCTAGAALRTTHGLDSEECKAGSLDILMIPGPDPKMIPSDDIKEFVVAHSKSKRTDVLTVCTGIVVAGHSGIIDGKTVTGPRALVPELSKKFGNAKWVEKRWSIDGNLWTSAGITNGLDMTAAYLKKRWPGPLSNVVCAMADVGDRSIDYSNGSTMDKGWWVVQILRAWVFGKNKDKRFEFGRS